jgi:hypothetical protein
LAAAIAGALAEARVTSSLSAAHGSKPAIAGQANRQIELSLGRPSSTPAPRMNQ